MRAVTVKFPLSALLAAAILAGCATPPAIDASQFPAAPAQFREGDGRWTVANPAEAQPRGEWWKSFSDPVLDDLVERADRNNTSIRIAAARLAQARALVQSANADRMPQLGIGAAAVRGDGLPNNPE